MELQYLLLKKGLTGSTDFIGADGTHSTEKYHQTMVDMAETMAGAYSALLKDGIQ